jgi:hypothetical protein
VRGEQQLQQQLERTATVELDASQQQQQQGGTPGGVGSGSFQALGSCCFEALDREAPQVSVELAVEPCLMCMQCGLPSESSSSVCCESV